MRDTAVVIRKLIENKNNTCEELYRDILSMMWLMRVSEKPGMSLWMISLTKRSVTPGQLRSASSKDARRSITSVEFRFPLLLLVY